MAVIILTVEAAKRRGIKRLQKVDPAVALKLWWAKHDAKPQSPELMAKLADIEHVYPGNTVDVPSKAADEPEQPELWWNK